MSFFPCKNFSDCVPPAEGVAVRNLSAEGPDRPSFFGLHQCLDLGTNPPFETCTSIVSQEQADWCAARCLARGIFTNDAQSFTACGNTFTVAAGTILANSVLEANQQALKFATASANALCLFGNTEQTCSVVCPNSAISSYTVPANSFRGPSQAILNQQAQALACETANLLCFGALVYNTEQSCSIVCQGTNGTATVAIPAGTVLGFTLESANARALELACALALIACDSLPPLVPSTVQTCSQICNGVTITQTVPAGAFVGATLEDANLIAAVFCFLSLSAACQRDEEPPVENVGNRAQTCAISCASGGTFSSTVQAGAFRLENQSAADAAALSYCQAHIVANSFCLGDLAAGICVNEIYAAVVSTTGPGTPTTMGVTSGVLPPGLSLSAGLLSGIPITPGSYTFTISAANANGLASRTYTIVVAEIQTVILSDGSTSSPYAEAILVAGFTDPVFTIVGGTLPSPLTLHPATGVISGDAPTESGDFAFVVQVQDSNATCLQDYVLTITGNTIQAYWRLEGPAAANHDEITGDLLTYNNFGAVLTSPAAVVGNGLDIGGAAFCTFQQQGPTLAYAGPNGFSVALWIRWSSALTGNEGFAYQWDNIGLPGFLTWTVGTGEFHFSNLGADTTGNTALLAADVFHFVVFTYDPADGNLRFSANGGAFVILGNPGVVTPVADPAAYMVLGNEGVTYDEVQLYSFALRAVDVAYLYNAGAGRAYPPSFPP